MTRGMTPRNRNFDPKNAKPHERHNRARAAIIGYKQEARIDHDYISGISDDQILRSMLIDIELMLVHREAQRERLRAVADHMPFGPLYADHPDARGLNFIVSIGGKDIYLGADTTGSTFIVICSDKGGDYVTTDSLRRYMPGFFDIYR